MYTYVCIYMCDCHFCSRPSAVPVEVDLSNKVSMWHTSGASSSADSSKGQPPPPPPCRIAGGDISDAIWPWQPPPPSEVKGCPCSMDRNQSWPANPYTQAYNGTGLQFRKRLYILRGRNNSVTPVCSVRYPRIKPPRMDPGWSAYLG